MKYEVLREIRYKSRGMTAVVKLKKGDIVEQVEQNWIDLGFVKTLEEVKKVEKKVEEVKVKKSTKKKVKK